MTKENIEVIDLTPSQVTDLAKPFTNMIESITKFYENPKVKKGFEEWHLKKFGCKPTYKNERIKV